jgi:hypothetical protein
MRIEEETPRKLYFKRFQQSRSTSGSLKRKRNLPHEMKLSGLKKIFIGIKCSRKEERRRKDYRADGTVDYC